MRKFASNSESLMQLIEKEEGAINQVQDLPTNEKEIKNVEKSCLDSKLVAKNSEITLEDDETFLKSTSNAVCTENEIKVLGIPWNREKDELKFDLPNFSAAAEQENITKRHILGTTAWFFDLLGSSSPVIVPLKGIFQEVCDFKGILNFRRDFKFAPINVRSRGDYQISVNAFVSGYRTKNSRQTRCIKLVRPCCI